MSGGRFGVIKNDDAQEFGKLLGSSACELGMRRDVREEVEVEDFQVGH